jgi:hypothetical protein
MLIDITREFYVKLRQEDILKCKKMGDKQLIE